MAKTTQRTLPCFSFAAYAKTLITHLSFDNIPIADGLSGHEFKYIQSIFGFNFPPDLRSILEQGLPVGPGFPNWRSSSPQQLHILINLPILGILKLVSQRRFWFESWGAQPTDKNDAVFIAKRCLSKLPVLVPLYRNFYIPSMPNAAGNPVFYISGEDIRVYSFDVAGFFKKLLKSSHAPAWEATEARVIEFWTEVAEGGGNSAAHGWWKEEMGVCLEDMFWRLRDGGWTEEEVNEMLIVVDRGGGEEEREVLRDGKSVVWHLRLLSLVLLRAGWSREDVVDSLGFDCDEKTDFPNVKL